AARILLAGEGPRPGADPEDEDEQRQHEAEQLRVEEARARAERAAPGDPEERLEDVRIALDQLVERAGGGERGVVRRDQGDAGGRADAPAGERLAMIGDSAPRELSRRRQAHGRAPGRSPPGWPERRRGRRRATGRPP